MELSPQLVEQLVYGFGSHRRQTQDSPVLPDVWAYFATPSAEPGQRAPLIAASPDNAGEGLEEEQPLELLLTPHFDAGPATLASELRARLMSSPDENHEGTSSDPPEDRRKPRRIAYTQSYVAARLYFDEVVRVLLPLTPWWRTYVWKGIFKDEDSDHTEDRKLSKLAEYFVRQDLVDALVEWSRTQIPETLSRKALQAKAYWVRSLLGTVEDPSGIEVADDLLWMVRIIGTIRWAQSLTLKEARSLGLILDQENRVASLPAEAHEVDYRPIVDAACDLLECELPVVQARQPSLWQINRNRPARPAVSLSRRAIKADAAIHLFDIHCDELAWAVFDSGIDASHPAFLLPDEPRKERAGRRDARDRGQEKPWYRRTRVKKTYDFTRLRPLLDQELVREILNAPEVVKLQLGDEDFATQITPILEMIDREDRAEKARAEAANADFEPSRGRLRGQLRELNKRLQQGREIDWEILDPLLEVPHYDKDNKNYEYPVPTSSHGTHVAGILAGKSEEHDFTGICPDLWLYDMRVLDPHGPNDEFTVLAALQFVQYLNLQKEVLSIQGANISLSIRHDVSTYACGRTPVCEECERLVSSGVVVVAAGGNAGWDDKLAQAAAGAGYRTVSITDPGNSEVVITVGATHRDKPHSYGVSFFSSRGPTGDGRPKPDLVAPGEKITSTIPGNRLQREDGTSMAAPHVSGAAALLMARHRELVGRPQRVKEILCNTATDLGRERHFQGAGMLDVLRALQSV